ncbi:hypothetical protein RHSIM_Rhsim02G0063100 [Rhododendron simsii]|uniref:Protein kinase domain-containing protein n=1 Tax=Rhododendron simsii TaxID=118357 RepID=A0A834LTB9_RHOSS|nr:hypothetical protein RHSIM_Rhsim02G0063100 [Rhododendron simsii]
MSSSEGEDFAENRLGPAERLVSSISGGGTGRSHKNKLPENKGKVPYVLPVPPPLQSFESENGVDSGVIQSEESCRCFSLDEILKSTNNFDEALVIGNGGFGNVYKGFIDDGAMVVAIKRLNAESKQGAGEFWTEVKMLSKLRHTHLVGLIGHCSERQEMILVYEYIAQGTLASHLYRIDRQNIRSCHQQPVITPPPSVAQRLDFQVFSMVDSSINSPDVDPEAYSSLLETIQGLGKGYRSFDESSNNFPRFPGLPVIPGIHIPLQSDDSAVRSSQFVQGTSCQTAGADADPENLAEWMATGAQAGTSTSSAEPLSTSEAGGSNAPPRPPRDIDTIPPLPSGLGPMSYNHFYGDGPGGFTEQTGSAIERPYRIPRARGFPGSGDKPDCSAPNKGLFVTGKWPNLIALLQCPNRDAPTLLDYEPTYAGFAHRKDKSKMVRKTVDLATVAGQALQQQYQAQDLSTAGLPERKEQPDQVPISHLEQQEPPARTETHSRRRRDSDSAAVGEDERAAKKGKTNENVEILSEADPADQNEPSEAFLPDFECSDGHVISVDDSLGESPLLAMTLLRGLALPKDMENLPTGKANNMAELCLFLAKVGQCASKAFGDMEALLETRRSMRVDLQAKRREADQFVDLIEELEAQIA